MDAEGFEKQVLESAALEKWQPSVVTAEHNFYESWEEIVLRAGYRLTMYDGLNRFYVHQSRAELEPARSLPALRSMDRFEPWLHVHQLEQAHSRIRELEAALAASSPLDSRLARVKNFGRKLLKWRLSG